MICPHCAQPSPDNARFCSQCGSPLTSDSTAADASPAEPESREEFKPVTILFADIVASTELVSKLDPEEAMRRLSPAVSLMRRAVERFGGTVIHTLGDGIMALFGAPQMQEGHALLGCQAALNIQAETKQTLGATAVRIGLHSGLIVAETKFSGAINEREAYGVAIHIANRVQSLADPGAIYLSEDCYHLVERYCSARLIGRRSIRGLSHDITVYELFGLQLSSSGELFRNTNLTLFQAREREMADLEASLQAALRGESHVVGICGSAGSGKSRLCYEFAERCRRDGIPVIEVRVQPYGKAAPIQPILEAVRSLLRISTGDDPANARNRVMDCLEQLGSPPENALPILLEFLGIAESSLVPAMTPKIRHAALLDTISWLIRGHASKPYVVILEDLHWLDEASEAFLDVLWNSIIGSYALMIINYRPSYRAPWMERAGFHHLELKDLERHQMDGFISSVVGSHADLEDVRNRIAERSDGNPFFAEEIIHSLIESQVLVGKPGDYRLGGEISDNPLPVTLQAVIGERIDRLPTYDRTLLQMASVIGKEVPYAVLKAVSDQEQHAEIEPALLRLCAVELLQDHSRPDGRYYSFRHPLIQEVAYSSQLKARRSRLHAFVAPALVSHYAERQDEVAGLISFHYEAAGILSKAAEYARKAAEWIGSMHPAQAIRQWQVVHRLVHAQSPAARDNALLILSSAEIAWLGWREGMGVKDAAPYIQEALAIAKETDDTMIPLLLFVEARISGASGGAADHYVARVRDALAIVDGAANQSRAATLYASLSQAYGWAGLFKEALEANDRALSLLQYVQDFENRFLGYSVEHWTLSLRARILIHLNRIDEGRGWLDHMLAIEDGLIDPTVQFISHLGYVDLAWLSGDAALAHRHATHVSQLAERHGTPYLKVFAYACTAMANQLAGDTQAAIQDFEEGLNFMHAARAALDYEPDMMAGLAECQAHAKQYGEALLTAERTISLSRDRATRLTECRALMVAGEAMIEQFGRERCQDAISLLEEAEALIRTTGATVLEPRLKACRDKLLVRCS
ncbi:adenylate/guanylate cyclase domain-containing protein [Microvirga sp. CF3016]|uniref:adenylate/guanylate cyclase domain-containing protein n=1 Tax=Microvirga sp. CF3016 TaxID=3110181 RepID=UPI002E786D52|nr:adenylate/guanylate cyclase domain-containing protein [Microvirga sp. CF3016]MEE1611432.1 adenylate/guanylate cyclase domain-containing protein [Microvirga sp. CF3016]